MCRARFEFLGVMNVAVTCLLVPSLSPRLSTSIASSVAHFTTPFDYDNLEEIHAALNGILPSDIRVREISPALPEFHAQFFVISKVYHYKIYNDTIMDPFQRHFAYHSAYKLNSTVMREVAKYFIGGHDFFAFANVSQNDRVLDLEKQIFKFDVIDMGALLQLKVEGSGFLYRQVRNMVMTMVAKTLVQDEK